MLFCCYVGFRLSVIVREFNDWSLKVMIDIKIEQSI